MKIKLAKYDLNALNTHFKLVGALLEYIACFAPKIDLGVTCLCPAISEGGSHELGTSRH